VLCALGLGVVCVLGLGVLCRLGLGVLSALGGPGSHCQAVTCSALLVWSNIMSRGRVCKRFREVVRSGVRLTVATLIQYLNSFG
jgi:hypothetical protein